MNKLILILSLMFYQFQVQGQMDSIPLVKVTGEYALNVKPDYVILGVRINKYLSSNSTELKTGFRIFDKEDTKIRLFDFDDKDITETLIRLDKNDNRPVYIKDIFITIRDMEKLDEILLQLHKLGFSNYRYIDYRVSDLESLKDKARTEAVKCAREKAIRMTSALGQTIGKAHTIEDLEIQNINWYGSQGDVIRPEINSGKYLADPGYIVIMAKVRVSFELK